MANTARITVRLPRECLSKLESTAMAAGYSSGAQLARSVLTQFVNHQQAARQERERHCEWIDDLVEEHVASARVRNEINGRI